MKIVGFLSVSAVIATGLLGAPAASAACAGACPPASVAVTVAASGVPYNQGRITATWPAVAGAVGYAVKARVGGALVATSTVVAPLTTATITGLRGGTTYDITVQSADADGFGDPSVPVQATALTVPASPAFTVDAGGTVVSWTDTDNGGAAIDSYTVTQVSSGSIANVLAPASSAPAFENSDTDVANYTVTATNAVGTSATGEATFTAPTAPRSLVATGSSGNITATWQPPLSNGGSAISSYRATLTRGATTIGEVITDPGTLTASFNSIPAGTYAVAVRASNTAVGGGEGLPAAVDVVIQADGDVVVVSETTAAVTVVKTTTGTTTNTPTSTPTSNPPSSGPTAAPRATAPTLVRATASRAAKVTLSRLVNITPRQLWVKVISKSGAVTRPKSAARASGRTVVVTFKAPAKAGRYTVRIFQRGATSSTQVARTTLAVGSP